MSDSRVDTPSSTTATSDDPGKAKLDAALRARSGRRFARLRRPRAVATGVVLAALAVAGALIGVHLSSAKAPLPAGVAARVGNAEVTVAQFDTERRVVTYSDTINLVGAQGLQAAGFHLVPLGNPTTCAAWIRRYAAASTLAGHTDAQLRGACQTDAGSLTSDTLKLLLTERIDQAIAPGLGAGIDQTTFTQQLQKVYDAFGGQKDLAAFTAGSGITNADLQLRLRQSMLDEAVEAKVEATASKTPTEADLRHYYKQYPDEFVASLQRRDIDIVVTKTQASAAEALQRIKAGQTFSTVAQALTVSPYPASGSYHDVSPFQVPDAIHPLLFTAPKGKLFGPTEVSGVWVVFRVDSITPQKEASFASVKPQLEKDAVGSLPLWAWQDYQQKIGAEWLPKIRCAPAYYVPEECGSK